MITRTDKDDVVVLQEKIQEALEQIESLDDAEKNNEKSARAVWDWVFKSDGFFAEYDEASRAVKAESVAGRAGKSLFDIPWVEKPPWVMRCDKSAIIRGRWNTSESGINWRDSPATDRHSTSIFMFGSSARRMRHLHIRFTGR